MGISSATAPHLSVLCPSTLKWTSVALHAAGTVPAFWKPLRRLESRARQANPDIAAIASNGWNARLHTIGDHHIAHATEPRHIVRSAVLRAGETASAPHSFFIEVASAISRARNAVAYLHATAEFALALIATDALGSRYGQ